MAASVTTGPRWVRPAARWLLPEVSAGAISDLEQQLGVPRLVAAVLVRRGYGDHASASEFLSPDLNALHDPFAMRDMDRAVTRLAVAVARRERILLYGDYDVDGTSSIVVLKKAIEILGGQADFHIPHRLKDGYGMRSEVIERAAETGVRLIVSVDTGIRANEVVRHTNELGIETIVTDHHLPEAELPQAIAVLNPNRRDCDYPNKHLCGAGVTFKLVQGLLARSTMPAARQTALLDSFLKPVAIATVADIVPLVGENRVMVRRGLSGLRDVRNPGLRALLAVAGFDLGECPSAHQVAFRLAPRINAAGRMATAHDVIELFLTSDVVRARDLAEQLDTLNRERQQVESEIVDAILKQCEEEAVSYAASAMVFAGAGWHLGVLGIVASRLVERFSRPVFVLSDAAAVENEPAGLVGDARKTDSGSSAPPEEVASSSPDLRHAAEPFALSGSGRSIPAFHLLEALESMPTLFKKFGGHRQAAGVTLHADQLSAFRQQFSDFAATKLTADDLKPEYSADAEASFAELTEATIQQVLALGPFGFGNACPLFYARAVEIAGPAKALSGGKHFNVPLRHNGRLLFAKAWNFADRASMLKPGTKLDVLFQIEDDPSGRKRGYGSWSVSIKDVRPAD
jgi:single-stranded-DNA-specific exonuclease